MMSRQASHRLLERKGNTGYVPGQELWADQERALEKILRVRGRRFFALLMAMRTGKSPVAVAWFGTLEKRREVEDFLLLAPAGVYRTWVEVLEQHASADLRGRLRIHVYRSGAGKRERAERGSFMLHRDGPRALLINVEALSRPGEARELTREFVCQRRAMAAVDESTAIMNRSKRTQFINRSVAPASEFRLIMSGLATPKSPLDLFYQMEFLSWEVLGFRSYYAFRAHVAHMRVEWFGGRRVEVVDKEKGDGGYRPEVVAEVRELIDPCSFRVEFRPAVPPTYSFREVAMTREQERAYREMRDDATTVLDNTAHVTATVVIAQLVRMHQVLVGHVRDEEGRLHLLPENRTAAVLEELADYRGKAVVWFAYVQSLETVEEALRREYGPLSVARFYGGNAATREREEHEFKTRPERRFMLATPGAGGKSRTWSVADLAIYHSSTDDLEKRDQSEQRTMGVKKDRGVDNVDLVCPGTVEEKIIRALRRKINMATTISGDNYREWLV